MCFAPRGKETVPKGAGEGNVAISGVISAALRQLTDQDGKEIDRDRLGLLDMA
jgi:hypothetical protein